MTIFRFSAFMLCGLLVSACGGREIVGQDDRVCETPILYDVNKPVSSVDEQGLITEQCVHKWAYRLARAPGSNAEIAKGTMGACRSAFDTWKIQLANTSQGEFVDVEGKNRYYAQTEAALTEQALFRVVQARAGSCSIK